MPLYNLRTDPSGDVITKFDSLGNPEATYRVAPGRPGHCDCPAGQRPTCRHRQMLPYLRPYANSPWFLDWDNDRKVVDFQGTLKSWHDSVALSEASAEVPTEPTPVQLDLPHHPAQPHSETVITEGFDPSIGGSNPPAVATPPAPAWRRF